MDQRIHFITLGVKDLEKMKSFYISKFGWTPIKDSDGIVFFKMNGFILSLFPSDELAGDIGNAKEGSGFKTFTLSINFNSAAEVDAAFNTLVEKGVRSVRKPEAVFWGGYRGYISDPEDNFWELAYNPYLTLDSNGNVASHR